MLLKRDKLSKLANTFCASTPVLHLFNDLKSSTDRGDLSLLFVRVDAWMFSFFVVFVENPWTFDKRTTSKIEKNQRFDHLFFIFVVQDLILSLDPLTQLLKSFIFLSLNVLKRLCIVYPLSSQFFLFFFLFWVLDTSFHLSSHRRFCRVCSCSSKDKECHSI
mmetsp:Transcript_12488/g.16295  ORF Transcript_12488/g.16295 Transcript_12488/m.16295 type:complete len:162 (+) Transcript_12488:1203-1688(+)